MLTPGGGGGGGGGGRRGGDLLVKSMGMHSGQFELNPRGRQIGALNPLKIALKIAL